MKSPSIRRGFTLVELLVSMALLSLVSVLLVSMTNSTASTWRYTSGKNRAVPGCQQCLRLDDPPPQPGHAEYVLGLRQRDRRPPNICGSPSCDSLRARWTPCQALPTGPRREYFFRHPLGYVDDTTDFSGMENLLNTWGYYVEFNKDIRPTFINALSNPPPRNIVFA